jgi:pimeloyl-ACP methyl ester carboxylesterase
VRRTAPQFLSRLLTNVAYYFELDGMRRAVLNIVEDALRERNPGGGPVVVVGHGLGSVVAYDLLTRLSDDIDVRLLVTAGSPLGHPIVQKNLLGGENNRRPRVPRRLVARRAAWVNAYDVQDFASLVHPDRRRVRRQPGGPDRRPATFNPTDPHSIAGYLADPDVSGPIGHAMHEG